MLLWDTTPIIDLIDEISAWESQMSAAINWDDLSPEKKEALTKARMDLLSKISMAEFQAEDGRVGHYVDIQGIINKLRHAQDFYNATVKQIKLS